MKKSIVLILCSILFGLTFLSCSKKDGFVSEKAKYDIELVKVDIGSYIMKDLYNPEPLEKLENDLIKKHISRDEAVIRLSKILADYNVVHLSLNADYPEFYNELMPMAFRNQEDDVFYVYFSTKQYEKYIGWKVLKMGDFPIKEALEKYNQFFPFETPTGAKYSFNNIPNFKLLRAAGLLNKNGTLSLLLESPEGKTELLKCKSINQVTPDNSCYLLHNAVAPVYINMTKNTVAASYGDLSKKTYYFQTFGFDEYRTNNFAECLEDMCKELSANQYNTVVFDMRFNAGGSIYNLVGYQSLIYKYKELLEKHNIAVVISGKTYSAAVMFINYLYTIFPNITFFGEESGQAIFNYTDVHPETLPNLKCHIIFPRAVEPMEALEKRAVDVHRGIMPDVEVYETFDDLKNGIDTVYEAICDYYSIHS